MSKSYRCAGRALGHCKTVVLSGFIAFGLASESVAADIYPDGASSLKDGSFYAPPYRWTGFYVGGNGGYAVSDLGKYSFTTGAGATGTPGYSLKPEGGFGGGQAGYNLQRGSFVYGVEADFQGGAISDKGASTIVTPALIPVVPSVTQSTSSSLDVNWFGTVRGRFGFALDNTLIYATGGFAFGNVDYKAAFSDTIGGAVFLGGSLNHNETLTGWTVGGGFERAVDTNWSVKAEYQYVNLGSATVSGSLFSGFPPPVALPVQSKIDTEFHTIRVGLNYKLSPQMEPLK